MADSQPRVLCVMPTQDRNAFAEFSVIQFLRQTYQNTRLLVVNSGRTQLGIEFADTIEEIRPTHGKKGRESMVANQREALCHEWAQWADIVAFWEDDDWYHDRRLEEHVLHFVTWGCQTGHGYSYTHYYNIENQKRCLVNHKNRSSLFCTALSGDWWRKNGFPDTRYPDVDLWVELTRAGGCVLTGRPEDPVAVGIKYESLPRVGIGNRMCREDDRGWKWLAQLVDEDQLEFYQGGSWKNGMR